MNLISIEWFVQVGKNERIVRNENKVPRLQVFKTKEEALARMEELKKLLDNKYIKGFTIEIFEIKKTESRMNITTISKYEKGDMGNMM
jgi:hypothetical protein